MEIKKPLDIDYDKNSVEDIIEKIEYAIEQHSSFLKVIPKDELLAYEETKKKILIYLNCSCSWIKFCFYQFVIVI